MDVSAFTSSAYYASYSPQSYRFLYVLDWCHYFPLMSFIWFYCMIKHYIASPVQGVSMLTWAVAVYTVKCWLNSFLHWEEKKNAACASRHYVNYILNVATVWSTRLRYFAHVFILWLFFNIKATLCILCDLAPVQYHCCKHKSLVSVTTTSHAASDELTS